MARLCGKSRPTTFNKCYKQILCLAFAKYSSARKETSGYSTNLECSSEEAFVNAKNGLKIIHNFTTETEENTLVEDIEPQWRRVKYQEAHWDNVR